MNGTYDPATNTITPTVNINPLQNDTGTETQLLKLHSAEDLLTSNYDEAILPSQKMSAKEALANYKASKESREWEKYLQDTAHQREVEDLKNAGLNPWLSTSGNGASSSATALNASSNLSSITSAKEQSAKNTVASAAAILLGFLAKAIITA